MDKHDACEQAYKRGYEDGKRRAVKHGYWIPVELDIVFRCSRCECRVSTSWDYDEDGMFDYCPACGAKMDGGEYDEID